MIGVFNSIRLENCMRVMQGKPPCIGRMSDNSIHVRKQVANASSANTSADQGPGIALWGESLRPEDVDLITYGRCDVMNNLY